MNVTTRIAAAALTLFAAAGSIAAEGTQDFADAKSLSTKSRAEVVAQIQGAAPATIGEASVAPVAVSTLERARVVAETREAMRLGLIGPSYVTPEPTAKQLELIRLAGDRAVAQNVAAKR